jgi:ABC-type glycerol-3-phosphate transport system substrate-binding protein
MQKMFRLLMAAVLALVLASPLMARGSREASTQSGAKQAVTVVLWSPMYDESATTDITRDQWYISQSIRRFEEKNPAIAVEYVPQPWDTIPTLYKTASLAGNGPDLYMTSIGSQIYPNMEFFEPLNGYFSKDELEKLTGTQYCYKNFDFSKMLYAIPIYQNMIFLYYNKDLFGEAGLPRDVQFKDKGELFAACQKLKDAGIQPFTIGDKEGFVSDWGPEHWVLSRLGPQFTIDALTSKAKFANPDFINAFKAWQELYEKGYCNRDAASLGYQETTQYFLNGRAAMYIEGNWSYVPISTAMKSALGIMHFPSYTSADPYLGCVIGSPDAGIAVSNYSKSKQQAVLFIKHLVSADEQLKSGEVRGTLANLRGLDESQIPNLDENYKKMIGYVREGKVFYYMFDLQAKEVVDLYLRLCPLVLSGKMTVEDFAKQIDDKKASIKSIFAD